MRIAYVAAGFLAHPDWGAAVRGLVVPTMPMTRSAVLIATATLGTTLAPWGLSFIQSYAADKRLTVSELRYERVDGHEFVKAAAEAGAGAAMACIMGPIWRSMAAPAAAVRGSDRRHEQAAFGELRDELVRNLGRRAFAQDADGRWVLSDDLDDLGTMDLVQPDPRQIEEAASDVGAGASSLRRLASDMGSRLVSRQRGEFAANRPHERVRRLRHEFH